MDETTLPFLSSSQSNNEFLSPQENVIFLRAVTVTKMVNKASQTWTVSEYCSREIGDRILESDFLELNPRFTTF